MKKIEAVVKPFKFDEIIEALKKESIQRITVFEVKGAGSRQGRVKHYRGAQYVEDSPEIKSRSSSMMTKPHGWPA